MQHKLFGSSRSGKVFKSKEVVDLYNGIELPGSKPVTTFTSVSIKSFDKKNSKIHNEIKQKYFAEYLEAKKNKKELVKFRNKLAEVLMNKGLNIASFDEIFSEEN